MDSSLTIVGRTGFGVATIMSRKSVDAAAIEHALGMSLPRGPTRIERNGLATIGIGPATWLAMMEAPETGWPASLERKLKGLASVSDQSGSYAVFRIAGDNVRTLLQRGAHIDLHPNVFGQQSVATTVIAHIGVVLWQADDDHVFNVATFRSYAPSLLRWLTTTAASL